MRAERLVLVLEPDPASRLQIASGFEGSRFRVSAAPDMATASVALAGKLPDVVVADLEILGPAAMLQQEPAWARGDTPLIVLSDHSGDLVAAAALDLDAWAVLWKPHVQKHLVDVVDAALRRADRRLLASLEERVAPAEIPARSVGVATGLLMERFHLGEVEAYQRLRRYARSRRLKVAEVTDTIVATSERLSLVLNGVFAMVRSDVPASGGSQPHENSDPEA